MYWNIADVPIPSGLNGLTLTWDVLKWILESHVIGR